MISESTIVFFVSFIVRKIDLPDSYNPIAGMENATTSK